MKTLNKKIKSICLLALSALLCLCVAVVALKTNNNSTWADYSVENGFIMKGAYLQIEEGTSNDSQISVNFVAEVTQNFYNAVTEGGKEEVKLGLLVGPTSKLNSVTNYATAISQGYNAFAVGSENSGVQQIMFKDGVAEIEFGILYNEATLSTQLGAGKTLIDATSVELTAIPYVISLNNVNSSADDEATCYLSSAVTRSPRAMLHEAYVRSVNFDYDNNSDADFVPAKITKSMLNKFVVADSNYTDKTGSTEYFISQDAGCLFASDSYNKLDRKNLLVPANGYSSGDKVYLGGVEFDTSVATNVQHSMLASAGMPAGDEYHYSMAIFKADGKILNYTVKVATRVIVKYYSGDSQTFDGIADVAYDENGKKYTYQPIFGNDVLSTSNRLLTKEIDGYYVLGNDITIDAVHGLRHSMLQSKIGVLDYNSTLYNDGSKGFTGTFDGRGFAIADSARSGSFATNNNSSSNSLCETGTGLFVWISGGTVKNLSLVNLTSYMQPRYNAFLAHAITNNSVIENVYVRALPYSYNGVAFGTNSISRERGAVLAGYIQDSTLRNVVIESDFTDKDDQYIDGFFHVSAFEGYKDARNTFENVFVLGDTPPSYGNDKKYKKVTFWVGEMPKINATEYAVDGAEYVLGEYPTLLAEYGEHAAYILNKSRGPVQANYADVTPEEVVMVFELKYPNVKQFSGYRELAEFLSNSANSTIKNALVNSGFYTVASNGFVTPKHLPTTLIAENNSFYVYGVDDMVTVSVAQWVNSANPIRRIDNCPSIMVMADANGKFYADLSVWAQYVTGTKRLVKFNINNPQGTGEPTVFNASTIGSATNVEITSGSTLYQIVNS